MRRFLFAIILLSAFVIALAPEPTHTLYLPNLDRRCPAPPWPRMVTGESCHAFYPPPYATPLPYCRTNYTLQMDLVCWGYVQPPGVTYVFPSPPPGGWPTQTPTPGGSPP